MADKQIVPVKRYIDINITSLLGTSFKVRMFSDETILDIKRRIYIQEGIPMSQQHLVLNSMELSDDSKISDYKMTDGTSIQLIPSMRGGPISFRRVPVMNNFENELAALLNGMDGDQFDGKVPVAVVVFHDGTELHFFQFLEMSDPHLNKATIASDLSVDVKPEDTPAIREKKEVNAKTRSTVNNLKKKMADDKVSKNSTLSRSGVQSSTKPTVTAGTGSIRRQLAVNKVNLDFAADAIGTQPSSSSTVSRSQVTTRTNLKESPKVSNRSGTEVSQQQHQQHQRSKPVSSTDLLAILSCAPGSSRRSPTRCSGDDLLALNKGSSHRSVGHRRQSRTSSAGKFETERVLKIPSLQENQLSLSGSSLSSSFWRQESSFVTSDFQSDYRNYASSHGTVKLEPLTRRSQASGTLMNKLSGRINETFEDKRSTRRKPDRARCHLCNKKTGLANTFPCRCGNSFCAEHRYPEKHNCSFDYKTGGRNDLAKANPKVVPLKLPKL